MKKRLYIHALCGAVMLCSASLVFAEDKAETVAPVAEPKFEDTAPPAVDATQDTPPAAPVIPQDMPSDEMPSQQVEEIIYSTDDAPPAPEAKDTAPPKPEQREVDVEVTAGEQKLSPLGENWQDANSATVSVLNRLLGQKSTIDIPLNTPTKVQELEITLHRCMDYPIINKYGDRALISLVLEKKERSIGTSRDVSMTDKEFDRKDIFSGWLFSRIHSINFVQDPVYDVVLERCGIQKQRIKKREKPKEVKAAPKKEDKHVEVPSAPPASQQ